MPRRTTVYLLVLLILACAPAMAQRDMGTVLGTVSDGTGAVIPGAKITITEEATGVAQSVETDAAGNYIRPLLKPGGLMIASTINRTARAYALAIVGAERVLRWLPPGTHDWRRFLTPEELFALLRGAGLEPVDRKGFVFDPLRWAWRISDRDLAVNYVTASVKAAPAG